MTKLKSTYHIGFNIYPDPYDWGVIITRDNHAQNYPYTVRAVIVIRILFFQLSIVKTNYNYL